MSVRKLAWVVLLSVLSVAASARVEAANPNEAARHFRRGIALYNEADYRAALAEFRRAYALAPASSVLYDIGQTQYQMQDYAGALTTFEQYLTEAGAAAPHRQDVLAEMEILRARVGQITVRSNRSGAEVLVDDVAVGRTPLATPLTVSIGARRVTIVPQGGVPMTRVVEVAAGDRVPVSFELTDLERASARALSLSDAAPIDTRRQRRLGIALGWTFTGVFAVTAIATGALAISASRDLASTRDNVYPTNRAELDNKQHRTLALSIVADVFGVAAVAAGAVSLYLTLRKPPKQPKHAGFDIGPGGMGLLATF